MLRGQFQTRTYRQPSYYGNVLDFDFHRHFQRCGLAISLPPEVIQRVGSLRQDRCGASNNVSSGFSFPSQPAGCVKVKTANVVSHAINYSSTAAEAELPDFVNFVVSRSFTTVRCVDPQKMIDPPACLKTLSHPHIPMIFKESSFRFLCAEFRMPHISILDGCGDPIAQA